MRHKNQQAAENERLVLEALAGVESGKYRSGSEAARLLQINSSTVYRRLKGFPSRSTARIRQQLLSEAQEKLILKWIKQLTQSGYPVTYKLLQQIAVAIRQRSVASVNAPEQLPPLKQTIGQDWVPRFIQHHPHIKTVIGRRIEARRMYATTKDAINAWFDAFEETMDTYKIDKSNIYNMDETGFAIGSMESTRVIVDSTIRTRWQANPGRQEWVTVVECIGTDGMVLEPLVIFKGKNLSSQWIPKSLNGNWCFGATSKGWTSNHHGVEWLERVFEPSTRQRANGRTRLLICDGHDSHISGSFIACCMENNIQLLVLPPHTSHILQPLDVGIFGPLKKALTTALSQFHEAQLTRIQKTEWLEAYDQARNMSITAHNTASAWRGAGLVPLDRKKALRYLPSEEEVDQPVVETPPSSPTERRFVPVYLNSSSPELGALQRANEIVQEHLQALQTPIRKHLREQAVRSERHSTRRIILERENENLRNILNKRRDVKKGKRAVLKNKFLLSRDELRDGVLDAEKRSVDRTKIRGEKSNNQQIQLAESSLQDGESLDEEDNSEIRDCIVVSVE